MRSRFSWLKGLLLLRHPELVRELAEWRLRAAALDELRGRCPGSKIASGVRLLGADAVRISIGPGATVLDGTLLSCGDERNGVGQISIGNGTWIGQYNNLRAGGGDIRIGDDCLISQFCTLVASNHGTTRGLTIQSQAPEPTRRGITLGNDVWLGAGVAVMPGVMIGSGAVVGANAVVTSDIPANEIWAGVPAQRIGERK